MRTLAAIAIAPLAIVPVLVVLFAPWTFAHGGLSSLTTIVLPSLVVAYPMVILFGVPMHMALVRQRCTRWRDYAVAGLMLGIVPVIGYVIVAVTFEAKFALAAIPRAAIRNSEWGAIGAAVFGLSTMAVATAFWAVVHARRDSSAVR